MPRLCLFLLMAISSACADLKGSEIAYVDVFDGGSISLFPGTRKYGFLDFEGDASYCFNRDEYACVSSDMFMFAVPKDNLDEVEEWEYEGVRYSKKPKIEMKFMGREVGVYTIQSVIDEVENIFLYSPEDGLVGVMFKTDKRSKIYWLVQKTGFGKVK